MTTVKRRGQRLRPIEAQTYTLWRGPQLLGKVIAWTGAEGVFSGPFVPAHEQILMRAEWQTHMPAFETLPACVVRLPQPGAPHSLEFDTDDDDSLAEFQQRVVARDDVLRLEGDSGDLRAASVHVLEQAVDATLPPEIIDRLPAGALHGGSYWMVIVTLEPQPPRHATIVRDLSAGE